MVRMVRKSRKQRTLHRKHRKTEHRRTRRIRHVMHSRYIRRMRGGVSDTIITKESIQGIPVDPEDAVITAPGFVGTVSEFLNRENKIGVDPQAED
jgi:hypothetical protein